MKIVSDAIILDSHQLFGFGVQLILGELDPGIGTFVVRNLEETIDQLIRKRTIKLAFVDLAAQGVTGPATIKSLREKFPELRIIAVCADANRSMIFECLSQGAYGCILKTQSGPEILNAVRVVLSSGVYVPSSIVENMAGNMDATVPNEAAQTNLIRGQTAAQLADAAPFHVHLSKQQHAVLRLLTRGLSNKAIARELHLAEGTVKVHVTGIFKAMKVNSRVQAVVRSVEYQKDDVMTKLDFGTAGRQPNTDLDVQVTIN